MPLSLLIIDGRDVMRSGLRSVFSRTEIRVAAFARAQEALHVLDEIRPDVVLLSLGVIKQSGWDLFREIAQRHPRGAIVAWSSDENPIYVARAHALGACSLLTCSATRKEIVRTIRLAAAGKPAWLDGQLHIVNPRINPVDIGIPLSLREQDVVHLLKYGLSNNEISRTLGIGYETVKEYISSIMRKLSMKNRIQVAVWALRRELTTDQAAALEGEDTPPHANKTGQGRNQALLVG